MPKGILSRFLFLPETDFVGGGWKEGTAFFETRKRRILEVCPKCAHPSDVTYDHRYVSVKDQPIRGKLVNLRIKKRRLWCKHCEKPFTEPIPGIRKGSRTTERYKSGVLWACENFSDLSAVQRAYRCSSSFLYKALYQQLELKRRTRMYPWPSTIGIDEHSFKRNKIYGRTEFASVFIDYKNKRLFEIVNGKTGDALRASLSHIPGRENVRRTIVDLCDPFKAFIQDFFPNAEIIADKFHVLRLLTPAINRRRKEITGDRRTLPIRKLLLRNGHRLSFFQRSAIHRWLENHPELKEIYLWKERLHAFYRTRGYNRARKALIGMTDTMASSNVKEIKTLRRTLLRWANPILAYFKYGLTNGRTEGFNNKAKLVIRRAYGYRSFENYRLRLLNACA